MRGRLNRAEGEKKRKHKNIYSFSYKTRGKPGKSGQKAGKSSRNCKTLDEKGEKKKEMKKESGNSLKKIRRS